MDLLLILLMLGEYVCEYGRVVHAAISCCFVCVVGCKPISECLWSKGESMCFHNDLNVLVECTYDYSYKHALDGVWKVGRNEGILSLWNGGEMVLIRAILMTTCQVCCSRDIPHTAYEYICLLIGLSVLSGQTGTAPNWVWNRL